MLKSNQNKGIKGRKIYLDYAASAMPNPSSLHSAGLEAQKKLQDARRVVADVLSARPEEIIFTSGGTEGNNLAIQGVVWAAVQQDFFRSLEKISRPFKNLAALPHIITTNIEHPSVLETCKLLQKRNLAEVSVVPVESNGVVDPKKIKKEIKKNTVLVSVMYANNEIGTIQPIKEIAKEIRHYRKQTEKKDGFPFFHTDAVQAVNYLDLNVDRLGVDMLTLSGSKVEGAGRVGLLYKKKNVSLQNVWGGGDQELGLRPGTENLPEIVKFSSALVKVQKEKEKESERLTKLRDYFLKKLQNIPRGTLGINGDLEQRLPNNVNITIPKIPSDLLVIELSAKGIMASSKSACKSSRAEGSYVIKAIHPEADGEIGGLRFSLGKSTTKKDIDYTLKVLIQILTKLKKWYN